MVANLESITFSLTDKVLSEITEDVISELQSLENAADRWLLVYGEHSQEVAHYLERAHGSVTQNPSLTEEELLRIRKKDSLVYSIRVNEADLKYYSATVRKEENERSTKGE